MEVKNFLWNMGSICVELTDNNHEMFCLFNVYCTIVMACHGPVGQMLQHHEPKIYFISSKPIAAVQL
jgi:hypothetical protein